MKEVENCVVCCHAIKEHLELTTSEGKANGCYGDLPISAVFSQFGTSRFSQVSNILMINNTLDKDIVVLLHTLQALGRLRRIVPTCFFVSLGIAVFMLLIEKEGSLLRDSLFYHIVFSAFLSSAFAEIVVIQLSYFDQSRRSSMISVLDKIESMQAVGALIDALDVVNTRINAQSSYTRASNFYPSTNRDVPDAICAALKRLLRKVEAEEAICLNTRQYTRLHKALFPVFTLLGCKVIYDASLALQVARVLGVIGNRESLSYLHRLTKAPGTEEPLRQHASVSLALIEDRLSKQRQTNAMLLRPSALSTASGQLLRSASGTAQAISEETAQLLRPTLEQDETPDIQRTHSG